MASYKYTSVIVSLLSIAITVLCESIYDFTVNDIKGSPVEMSKFKGKVSNC